MLLFLSGTVFGIAISFLCAWLLFEKPLKNGLHIGPGYDGS